MVHTFPLVNRFLVMTYRLLNLEHFDQEQLKSNTTDISYNIIVITPHLSNKVRNKETNELQKYGRLGRIGTYNAPTKGHYLNAELNRFLSNALFRYCM